MQINHTHLKVLYDLLAMQQDEITALTAALIQKDGAINQLKRQLPDSGDFQMANGHKVAPTVAEQA